MIKKRKWLVKVAKEEEIEVEAATQQEAENEAICQGNVMMVLDDPRSKKDDFKLAQDEIMDGYNKWMASNLTIQSSFYVWQAAVEWAKREKWAL